MSEIRVDSFKSENGIGAPSFPNGIQVTGVVTATVLDATVPFLTVGSNAQLGNTGIITATGAVINGNLSATNGSFSGNVTIGGTLTYEDVTNIDSVGLITARNGISVSSGGLKVLAGGSNFNDTITGTATTATTITVSNDSSANTAFYPTFVNNHGSGKTLSLDTGLTYVPSTNVLTAGTFSGSGASLTNLPAANLTGTLPAIDGSNLTGIDASAITTGTTKVQTNATSIVNQISGSGIATITAQGLNVTGIVTATSMKVFSSGIDYEWQGGTAMAWWKSEDIASVSSWPAAKGGSNANLVSHATSGLSYNSSDSSFNNHKTIQHSGNNTGGLHTSNDDIGYWWNGNDAFTVIMAMRKESHNGGSSYGDSFFVHNTNSVGGGAQASWSIGPYGDHSWGGQYGEMWGGIQNYFEGLEMRFSFPWRGLFMIRMSDGYDYGELSVNSGSGWKRLDQRHNGPSGLGSSWRALSIFTNSSSNSGHSGTGRIAEWAYWRNKRLGGNELDAVTKSWCNKFNF